MDNTFNFDLQLFTDLGGDSGVDANLNDTGTGDISSGSDDSTNATGGIYLDENGEIVFDSSFFDEDGITEPPVEPQPKPEGQEPQANPPAQQEPLSTVKVNIGGQEREIPVSELANFYAQSQIQAQMQQQQQQQQATQQPPQNQPPEKPLTEADYYNKLHETAVARVQKIFDQPYDELNPLHQTALADEITNIKVHLIRTQETQAAINGVMSEFTTDPEFNAIDNFAFQLLQQLPYAQAREIESRIQNGDARALHQYMTYARNEYYNRKNGVYPNNPPQQQATQRQQPQRPVQTPSRKPLHMEGSGNGNAAPQANRIDASKLGSLKVSEQAKLFEQWGLTNL